jgi:hypothetical protein
VPGGFDPPERVRATMAALGRKRAREVARAEAMVAAAHLSARPVRLVVTVRAPGLGERWLSVPLGQGPR